MLEFPKVITSSVVRGAQKGESHGGLYIVDLANDAFEQVLNWADLDIQWEDSGRDRGLRGIAFYNDNIYIASSNEILVLNKQFEIVKRIENRYLGMCHEIDVYNGKLYISSTRHDAILVYDLKKEDFIKGYHIKFIDKFPGIRVFNPHNETSPDICNNFHINNVFVAKQEIYFSGLKTNVLFKISRMEKLGINSIIPCGTHNVQLYKGGLLMNDTVHDHVLYKVENDEFRYRIKKYKDSELVVPEGDYFARQSFGRGLTTWGNYIVGGSSPGTISLYHFNKTEPVKTINITMDIRNSIHGLEVWPF
jgi:hypothetical protein